MNRFVIVTFDMDGSMVTFEGSRFTETQQAAIFHIVERAGKEPVQNCFDLPIVETSAVRVHEVDTPSGVRYVAEAGLPEAPVAPVTERYVLTGVTTAAQAGTLATTLMQRDLKRAEAKAGGYTGEPCPTCHGFKTRRNGSCLLCEDCKSTTGCS